MKKTVIFISFLFINIFANEIGKELYTKHGCYGCHGIDAKGIGDYPKLAGKSIYYLKKRLLGYKNDTINSNRADMMKPFAKALNDDEIEILAKYLNSLSKKKKSDKERYYQEFIVGDSSGS